MKKKLAIVLAVFMIFALLATPVFASVVPNWLESFWMADPLFPGKPNPSVYKNAKPGDKVPGYWWRDTTNQNAIAQYYYDNYQWNPHVDEVVPGVYVVRGVGKSNVVALVGSTEWVLIDAMESPPKMQLALLLLRQYTGTKRLKALIYTCENYDHYSGSSVVAPPFSIPVYASSEFFNVLAQESAARGVLFPRTLRMLGVYLTTGPDGRMGPTPDFGAFPFQYPNNLISEPTSVSIAGFDMQLSPAPSVSDAGLQVWLPAYKVLIAGDAVLPAFPDISPLNAPSPSSKKWVATLNAMIALNPDYLIPTHGPVISQYATIGGTLADYRDAIKYVHDRTLFLMNTGLTAEDAAAQIQLPQTLASKPYLQEFENSIPSAVKAIYHEYAGWFNGEPPELARTLTTTRQAQIMVELAGGMANMIDKAKKAELEAQDLTSAEKSLLLAYTAYKAALTDSKYLAEAKSIYVQALKKNAYMQKSDQIRNYYLTVARELELQ